MTAPALRSGAAPWTASLIVPSDGRLDPLRPVRFRGSFAAREGERAALRVTSCGVYRVLCNGHEVGDHVLAPGWTSYHHRHLVQELDLTSFVVSGDNTLGIEVAEGWWRGRLGWADGHVANYGDQIGAFAQLTLTGSDGDRAFVTDETWRWAPSAILSASLYDGEHLDQRLEEPWTEPAFGADAWEPVRVAEFDTSPLRVSSVPPVRRIEDRPADAVFDSPTGRTLVDFGQNATGRVRIDVPAQPDLTITVRHAEVLEDGELGTRPLRRAAATDVLHTSGAGGTWEPTFTLHGFRYVEVEGWPGVLPPDAIRMVVCHTDLAEIGRFDCSDERLSRLHENVRWSAKGNFVSIPTDCPQRDERLGWTGDLQVFAPTAAFLFDCREWLESWLQDLAAEQAAAGGRVPIIIPGLPRLIPDEVAIAGWSDAAVVVPSVLYERTGDIGVLERQYSSMTSWVDACTAMAAEDGQWRRFQLGDWLDPTAPPDNAAQGRTDPHLVADAYRAHSARLVARAAAELGRDGDADRYRALADELRDDFCREHVAPDGRLASDSPTAYSLALCFDLLAEGARSRAGGRLVELVEADRFRIGTGFLGTPLVCDALVGAGAPDHAYRLLQQTECPSWLYPVTMGATTIWERWDSMLPDGSINQGEMTSFNHYAFGAVADFLHRRVAGLAPAAPGYREIDVRPVVGGGLTHAGAAHRTSFGDAEVKWRRDGDRFDLTVVVPPGCAATVTLPDGSSALEVGPGRHTFTSPVRPAADDPT